MKRLVYLLSRTDNAVLRPGIPRPRIHTMDELRGLAVLCMIFYHAFYTMAFLFGIPLGRTLLYFFMPAEPYFAGLFILISGISCQLSHSNLIRGAKLLLVAAAPRRLSVSVFCTCSRWECCCLAALPPFSTR